MPTTRSQSKKVTDISTPETQTSRDKMPTTRSQSKKVTDISTSKIRKPRDEKPTTWSQRKKAKKASTSKTPTPLDHPRVKCSFLLKKAQFLKKDLRDFDPATLKDEAECKKYLDMLNAEFVKTMECARTEAAKLEKGLDEEGLKKELEEFKYQMRLRY